MKKFSIIALIAVLIAGIGAFFAQKAISKESKPEISQTIEAPKPYAYPQFYRGIYLTKPSGKDPVVLSKIIEKAKASNINVLVIDVQPGPANKCGIPAENVKMVINAGLHPVARVVCFQDGLKSYPAPKERLDAIYSAAVSAAECGFREIQFDYIRFADSKIENSPTIQQRYAYIENIIATGKEKLKKFDVKVAVDIFGRIPLNKDDPIGQRMESLDKVADVICPMAYPSHYTWSSKMMKDPYFTVNKTSVRGKERVTKAAIIPYIQAFQIKVKYSGLSYEKYIEEQIRAVHDANVGGYIFWNARQDYDAAYKVMQNYYKTGVKSTSNTKNENSEKNI